MAEDVAFIARIFERYRLIEKAIIRGQTKPEIYGGV